MKTPPIEVSTRWRSTRALGVRVSTRRRYRSGSDRRHPLLIEDVVLAEEPMTLLEPGTEMVLA
jgi:hypothetical protein